MLDFVEVCFIQVVPVCIIDRHRKLCMSLGKHGGEDRIEHTCTLSGALMSCSTEIVD
jgi:hypothetical protein